MDEESLDHPVEEEKGEGVPIIDLSGMFILICWSRITLQLSLSSIFSLSDSR